MLREKNDTGYFLSLGLGVWGLEWMKRFKKKHMTDELI